MAPENDDSCGISPIGMVDPIHKSTVDFPFAVLLLQQ